MDGICTKFAALSCWGQLRFEVAPVASSWGIGWFRDLIPISSAGAGLDVLLILSRSPNDAKAIWVCAQENGRDGLDLY